jgi:coenzyme PQQ biosynthesis protein PqqD
MIPPDAWTPGTGLVPEPAATASPVSLAAGTGTITALDVPRLPRGVRLRHDAVRNQHVLLAPERTFDLDANAVAVLELVDGQRNVRDIAGLLGQKFAADPAVIEADILVMLNDLATKRVLER